MKKSLRNRHHSNLVIHLKSGKLSISGWIIVFMLLFSVACKKEIKPSVTEGDLRYFPTGYPSALDKALTVGQDLLIIGDQNQHLHGLSLSNGTLQWEIMLENPLIKLLPGADRSLITVETTYIQGVIGVIFNRLDHMGNYTYKWPNLNKMVSQKPNMHENILQAAADGKNGLYLLLLLDDWAGNTGRQLVHIDGKNQVDLNITLSGFYQYMTTNDAGDLFLGHTISSSGTQMTVAVGKVNLSDLFSQKIINYVWTGYFNSKEPDFKWPMYTPFSFFCLDNQLFVAKARLLGQNDLADGVEILGFDMSTGAKSPFATLDLPFLVNNYQDPMTLFPAFTSEHRWLAYNFGFQSRIAEFDRDGKFIREIKINGESNRSKITAISGTGSKLAALGISTLKKSPGYSPFLYLSN